MKKIITGLSRNPGVEEVMEFLSLAGSADVLRQEAESLVWAATTIASPKALYGKVPITVHGADYVELDGVRINSKLMADNFSEIDYVYPYICTCGQELERWSNILTDPLEQYLADRIKLFYLVEIQKEMFTVLRRDEIPDSHISRMNPGSLPVWPLSGQAELFKIAGGGEDIGVTLTESFLMLPGKSTSGIVFRSRGVFENCSLCPMPDCEQRRAPFNPAWV